MSSANLCTQQQSSSSMAPSNAADINLSQLLFLNESTSFLYPRSKINIYITEKWFRIDDIEQGTTFYYNNEFLFTFYKSRQSYIYSKMPDCPLSKLSPFLYIGLNRVIADASIKPGSGLCSASISFLNCHINSEPEMDINVKEMTYNVGDSETMMWVNPLNYLEPTINHKECSGEGTRTFLLEFEIDY
jgi:hypothetical protein